MIPDPSTDAETLLVQGPEGFDVRRPHSARIYDYLLGGKDNFAADRAVAEKVAELAPWVISGARGNRAFLTRAVRYLACAGVRQYLDLGSGLPSSGNVHQVAQAVDPESRVVYLDNDPLVLVHAHALLATDSRTIAVHGDARDPHAVLTDPAVRAHLDLRRPVAVLMVALLHFMVSQAEPARIVTTLTQHLAPGSFIVISHAADLGDGGEHPERAAATRAAAELYDALAAPCVLRTAEQVTALFSGFDVVAPGVVPAHLWRPAGKRPGPAIPVLAGIGRLPFRPSRDELTSPRRTGPGAPR